MINPYLLAISKTNFFTYSEWLKLNDFNLTAKDIFNNPYLINKYFPKKDSTLFINKLKKINIEKEQHKLEEHNISIITPFHKDYPIFFKHLNNPPPVLFAQGNSKLLNSKQLAVVGSRKPSPYSLYCLEDLLDQEICQNLTITSGLAKGIDSSSHHQALKYQGNTIAVLGYGFFNPIYPRKNEKLYNDIINNNGLIISEYYPDTPIKPFQFLQRNRIIAALCDKILIISAHHKSGSLTTAKYALNFNKDILVCPGPISTKDFTGSHQLIKDGAQIITSLKDLKQNFNFSQNEKKNRNFNLSIEENTILKYLYEPRNFQQLLNLTNLPSNILRQTLFNLERHKMIVKKGLYYYH